MATDTTERRPTKPTQGGGAHPPEPEHLPCPRCDSTNTKFCYYNNYNFSQPRHFCKSCRRYWTHGGTLRDIPIGGGTRKNAKRSRSAPTSAVFSSSHHDFHSAASPLLLPLAAAGGSFTSLLNGSPGNGLVALGGFGFGLNDVGFGMGKMGWPFAAGVVEGGPAGLHGGAAVGGNTWQQMENGEGGFVGGGDYFAFPDLAISTPRNKNFF